VIIRALSREIGCSKMHLHHLGADEKTKLSFPVNFKFNFFPFRGKNEVPWQALDQALREYDLPIGLRFACQNHRPRRSYLVLAAYQRPTVLEVPSTPVSSHLKWDTEHVLNKLHWS
jgi:hypothetical protein